MNTRVSLVLLSLVIFFSVSHADTCYEKRGGDDSQIPPLPDSAPRCGERHLNFSDDQDVKCVRKKGEESLTVNELLERCKNELCGVRKCPIENCQHPGTPKCGGDNKKCQLYIKKEKCDVEWQKEPNPHREREEYSGRLNFKIECWCACKLEQGLSVENKSSELSKNVHNY